jgi:Flp pilus assembly protein TadB
VVPDNIMTYIAGWFPVLSFIIGFVVYFYIKRAWLASLIVFGGILTALLLWHAMSFWSWLLLYLFICWFASWAAHHARKRRNTHVSKH